MFEILEPIYSLDRRRRASCSCPRGGVPRAGDVLRDPELADALERLGAEGAAPFYAGDIGAAVSERVCELGGMLTREDLAAYRAEPREPVRVRYRGREVLTNPPPSAGGMLLAYALALLERDGRPARPARRSCGRWSARRTSARRSSSPASPSPASSSASWPAGSARPRTSRCSTATAGPAR